MSAYALALVAALCWGLAPVFASAGLASIDPVAALLVRSLVIAVIMVTVGAAAGWFGRVLSAGWRPAAFIALEAILAAGLGHLAFYAALRAGDAARVVPLTAVYPLISIIAAVLMLREQVTPARIVGALLVVAGLPLLRR